MIWLSLSLLCVGAGSFVVSAVVGSVGSIDIVELLDMPRPFVALKAMDMEQVAKVVLDTIC